MANGTCDDRFAAVRAAFDENFATHNEVGAAVSVMVDGELVVDLWDGWLDEAKTRPWQADSISPVWSLGKGMLSIALLRMVDKGLVDLDAPVATYWPEFAQAGKDSIPVHMILSHQSGLPAIAKPLPKGATLDWDLMVHALEEQEPWWTPGSMFGYHVNTLGHLAGEIVRRIDGRPFGQFISEEVSEPLGVEFRVGFGREVDDRVAEWINYKPQPGEENLRPWLERDPATLSRIELAQFQAYRNPPGDPAFGPNTRIWRQAIFPSTNPHTNARAAATIYGALAAGGTLNGYELLRPETIERARTIASDGDDVVIGRPNRFGLGFQLTIPGVRPIGPGEHTFGHYGNGAVLGFADPDARVGFGYVCNRAGRSWRDPRNIALVDALYSCL